MNSDEVRTTIKVLKRLSAYVALTLTLMVSLSCNGEPENTEEESLAGSLVVVSYGGGAYQDSHKKAFIEPFGQKRNVKVESVVWGAEYGRLSEMVNSERVVWSVVEVTAAQFSRGLREGLFAKLAFPISETDFQPVQGGPIPNEFGVPNCYWSTVLSFRRSEDFGPTKPSNWADFWDVEKFPGPRALYDDPRGNLEFALLASGVPKDELYPLDVDLAFKKLNEIKPHVRVWWNDGTEPVRLLLTNQVVLTSAWSGRIFPSPQAREEIEYHWSGAAHELDYWVIPRGTTDVPLASEFINFASTPEPMARQAELTAYGPANTLALDLVDPSIRPFLPTNEPNWSESFVINSEWWSKEEVSVLQRWISWKNE